MNPGHWTLGLAFVVSAVLPATSFEQVPSGLSLAVGDLDTESGLPTTQISVIQVVTVTALKNINSHSWKIMVLFLF